MHKAICSECGEQCEVPFKPTGDKPVLCNNCFESKANANRSSGRNAVPSKFQGKRMYLAICAECGNECEVPFRPTPGKPIYCRNCFRKGDSTGSKKTEQFKTLHAKLDTIIRLLHSMTSNEATGEQPVTSKKVVSQPPKVTIIKQTKRTVSPKKAVKKKVAVKKTVTKKATKKAPATKKKKAVKQKGKTASPKKTVKKKAATKKTATKKATRKKQG
jgi:CxxC-x17-CxxC domain-containing protein